jgi:hypothetical protein
MFVDSFYLIYREVREMGIANNVGRAFKTMNDKIERLENSLADALELVVIRDRKIELQAREIAMLKKLLALQKPVEECPVEPSWFTDPDGSPETEEYPKYDELIRRP